MTLRVERLEAREVPAADFGDGRLFFDGRLVRPFEDWHGALSVHETADEVWVGAGSGGGPRVAVFDRDTGERDRPDVFYGDVGSRYGVVFVDPGPPPAPVYVEVPVLAEVPRLTYGDVSGREVWRVFLDFERPTSADAVERTARRAWEVFAPLGNVAVTTVRPNDYPGTYGTVVIGADLTYHPLRPAGVAPARWDGPPSGPYDTRSVYVTDFPYQPENLGVLVAHEAGHALGLQHRYDYPWTVMSDSHLAPDQVFHRDDVLAARAGAARAVAGAAQWRV